MSIRFYCSCGKHLKAKNDMAARRTVCPACGNPVGIPSLKPTQRGTSAAPLSPLERQTRQRHPLAPAVMLAHAGTAGPHDATLPSASEAEPALALSPHLDPEALDLPAHQTGMLFRVIPRKRKRKWHAWPLETRWHESLFYPLLAFPLVLGLALLLTILSGVAVLFWPNIAALPEREPYLWWVPCVLVPVLVIGYSCGFFRCILGSALSGEAGEIRWPGYDILLVLKSMLAFLLCLLPGPALLVVIAYYFWLEGGDPTIGDWLILGELAAVAIAHVAVCFLAFSLHNRLVDANPLRGVELVHKLGWRGRTLLLAGSAALAGTGFLLLDALQSLKPGGGWLALFGWWVAGFYLATLFFRWLGLYCYYHFRLR